MRDDKRRREGGRSSADRSGVGKEEVETWLGEKEGDVICNRYVVSLLTESISSGALDGPAWETES